MPEAHFGAPFLCDMKLMTFKASSHLLRYAEQPQRLVPAIRMTIGAASAHGLLMALV